MTIRDDGQGRNIGKKLVSRWDNNVRLRGIRGIARLFYSRNEGTMKRFSRLGYPALSESSVLDVCDHVEIGLNGEKRDE